jgi:hypothetical protein
MIPQSSPEIELGRPSETKLSETRELKTASPINFEASNIAVTNGTFVIDFAASGAGAPGIRVHNMRRAGTVGPK